MVDLCGQHNANVCSALDVQAQHQAKLIQCDPFAQFHVSCCVLIYAQPEVCVHFSPLRTMSGHLCHAVQSLPYD